MVDKIEYSHVADSDSEENCQSQAPRRRQWPSHLGAFFLGLVAMGIAFAVYSTATRHDAAHARILPEARDGSDPITGVPLSWSHGDCGNSPDDARARGCEYSIVLHSWLPKSCLTNADAEDAEDMYMGRDWPYKTEAGQNLTMEELGGGDYGHFTTTFDWHVTHCMYVWKRLHRILLDPTQELDSYTANYHHTSHCVKMIGGQPEGMKDSGTKIFVKYPKCAR